MSHAERLLLLVASGPPKDPETALLARHLAEHAEAALRDKRITGKPARRVAEAIRAARGVDGSAL